MSGALVVVAVLKSNYSATPLANQSLNHLKTIQMSPKSNYMVRERLKFPSKVLVRLQGPCTGTDTPNTNVRQNRNTNVAAKHHLDSHAVQYLSSESTARHFVWLPLKQNMLWSISLLCLRVSKYVAIYFNTVPSEWLSTIAFQGSWCALHNQIKRLWSL